MLLLQQWTAGGQPTARGQTVALAAMQVSPIGIGPVTTQHPRLVVSHVPGTRLLRSLAF